ncbi:MAG: chorismate mutase [Alphaproteobacteria bacterium]|nr:chorismate mutase [Alphaproteobacteria bacterium]
MVKDQNLENSKRPTLTESRKEIDLIDNTIHDLIMKRTEIVSDIATIKAEKKQASNKDALKILQPEREAAILRRLVSRHKGKFSKSALVSIWREIFGSLVQIQGSFPIAVFMPKRGAGYLEVARKQYGSCAETLPMTSAGQVVYAVSEGKAEIGIVPIIEEDDKDPWWIKIVSELDEKPRVIAKLPFNESGSGHYNEQQALVIAMMNQSATGNDRSLIIVEVEENVSRAKLKSILKKENLPFNVVLDTRKLTDGIYLHVVELADYVAFDDKRLKQIVENENNNVSRVLKLGGYAVPFSEKDLCS